MIKLRFSLLLGLYITVAAADIPRVIVSTDIGGSDPDDYQSMVHYLVYADRFDTEGLISSPPKQGRAASIHECLDAYEKDYANLKTWSPDYPSPDSLRALVGQGALDSQSEDTPPDEISEGAKLIVERAKVDDARPLYVIVWGSITDIAQAVHADPSIKTKLRVYSIGSWNTANGQKERDYLYQNHADLWWIESDTTFRGMYMGGKQDGDLGNRSFPEAHVKAHGALGELFMQKKADIKMGDTPSVLYFLNGDPNTPSEPHWGGAYVKPDSNARPHYWHDDPDTAQQFRDKPGANSVNRWREAYLRDWQTRMDRLKTKKQAGQAWRLEDMANENAQGLAVYRPRPMDDKFKNPWPAAYEESFQQRAREVIASQTDSLKAGGSTYFENEKRWYGFAMAHVLGGKAAPALKALQQQDHQHQEWHSQTEGIDYYACFTLKHQMRKYFYFGDLLDQQYRRTMFKGANQWTAQDPLGRPHAAYKEGTTGWGPDAKNSWVDVRSTDNLFLMRVTSVYLMAEETGNTDTANKYKEIILKYVATLYRVGLGEWDSENYLGHSIAPVFNLYDFARDEDVKFAAKAILDFFHAIGAVKYHHGAFNGPCKRDYNHAQPFGGSASLLWLPFGDSPTTPVEWESDEIHAITSAYRPPVAVVKLARGEHSKSVELFASKPPYNATTSANTKATPEYLETQYLAHTYKMGSLAGGTTPGKSDVSGFKIAVDDDSQGGVVLQAAPTADPAFPGSPVYKDGIVTVQNRVAQYENKAIWLANDGTAPWLWVIPDTVQVSKKLDLTFLQCDRTWVAILPLGISSFSVDSANTEAIAKPAGKKKAKFPDHQVISARGTGGTYCGFAVIVGEKESHGSFDRFQVAALQAKIDSSKLATGNVSLSCADGKSLGFEWAKVPRELKVIRDGSPHDWSAHESYLYRPANYTTTLSPISARWGSGELVVEGNGATFKCSVSENGQARFSNTSS